MERRKITRNLKLLYAVFAVAVLVSGGIVYATVAQGGQEIAEAIQSSQMHEPVPEPAKNSPAKNEAVTEEPEAPVDYSRPAPAVSSPAPAPAPQHEVQPERIPFTNKPVTPGHPSSYEGTYGQCPFYENAMSGKGCVVPPGITCNADWSHCTMTEEAIPTSEGDQHATK